MKGVVCRTYSNFHGNIYSIFCLSFSYLLPLPYFMLFEFKDIQYNFFQNRSKWKYFHSWAIWTKWYGWYGYSEARMRMHSLLSYMLERTDKYSISYRWKWLGRKRVTVNSKMENIALSPVNVYFTLLNQLVKVYYLGHTHCKGSDSQQQGAYV